MDDQCVAGLHEPRCHCQPHQSQSDKTQPLLYHKYLPLCQLEHTKFFVEDHKWWVMSQYRQHDTARKCGGASVSTCLFLKNSRSLHGSIIHLHTRPLWNINCSAQVI